jgi:hypothetical protein
MRLAFCLIAIVHLGFLLPEAPESASDQKPAAVRQSSQPPPCSAPEVRQFDFWVGEWDVTWPDGGKGTNVIERALDDCVVVENFRGATIPLRGTSVSTYNQQLGKWQQTWVDNQGGYLDFVGEYKDGRMVLAREAAVHGARVQQRMVWHNITKDSFDWNWERSDDGGKTWKILWPIHYARKSSSPGALPSR